MRIGLTFNSLPKSDSRYKTDEYAEFDDISVIMAIKKALESAGHEVILIEADRDAYEKLKNSNLDFVFNIAECMFGESRRSQIPAMLEMLNIPYTGSGVLTQAITLNKARTKEILGFYGIPILKFQLFKTGNEPLNPYLKFPLFVKPNAEGSSKGITSKSLVKNEDELRERVSYIINRYHQPALVEEYLDGREFTVSLLGNPPKVLPIVEVDFSTLPDNIPKFDCYEVKWFWDSPDNEVETVICPARIDKKIEARIKKVALYTFEVLGCVDLCRIDMRLDKNDVPNVLDVNVLPGLIPDPKENSRFPKACYSAGMTYDEIILSILEAAMKRYNIAKPVRVAVKPHRSLQ
ncbi:MAG: D-alanine--D-alanine ligase [Candidatus Aenigmarchaeota archaeon]|nr:D-alanine--D-alanine ligase [Candidatus Aenigmarchaeota archaeon]